MQTLIIKGKTDLLKHYSNESKNTFFKWKDKNDEILYIESSFFFFF